MTAWLERAGQDGWRHDVTLVACCSCQHELKSAAPQKLTESVESLADQTRLFQLCNILGSSHLISRPDSCQLRNCLCQIVLTLTHSLTQTSPKAASKANQSHAKARASNIGPSRALKRTLAPAYVLIRPIHHLASSSAASSSISQQLSLHLSILVRLRLSSRLE